MPSAFEQLTVCVSCGIVICGTEQPAVTGLCDGCKEAQEEDQSEDAEARELTP